MVILDGSGDKAYTGCPFVIFFGAYLPLVAMAVFEP
jgi:hypothetical protein